MSILGYILFFLVSFAAGYVAGTPTVIEQDVTKNVTAESAEFTGGRGGGSSGRLTIENVEIDEQADMRGAIGGNANGHISINE